MRSVQGDLDCAPWAEYGSALLPVLWKKGDRGVDSERPAAMKKLEKLEPEHSKFFTDMGYGLPVKLDGKLVALGPFLYTTGIMVGMDDQGYEYRFCYHTQDQAMIAMLQWIGNDEEEPAGYIVKK